MKRILLPFLLTLAMAAPAAAQSLATKAYAATAILYNQTASGGMQMRCTATAFDKVKGGYLFVSASHCVAEDHATSERVMVSQMPFYLSFDGANSKVFYPAEVVMAGYQKLGDDFAILRVETEEDWETVKIGDDSKMEVGEDILNVAAPKGLGRQIFFGYISMLNMDRPVMARNINWMHATLLQIYAGPGSSGSAVLSVKQKAIVAFIVGGVNGNPSVVAIPASRFLSFRAAVEAGTYEWFKLPAEPAKEE